MGLEEVKIELTNYCKRKCIHCSSDANTENVIKLQVEEVKRIVDECAFNHVSSIVLTGGEASEYDGIEEIVSYIRLKNFKSIKLYTMCEPTEEKYLLLKKLTDAGLTEIIYSLTISLTTDGMVTFENIEEFLFKISKINHLSFHYCLTKKTIEDIHKLEIILKNIPFEKISFLRYVPHGRGKDDLTLTSADLKKLKPKLVEIMEKYPFKCHFGSPFNILNITNVPCTAGSKTMIIGFDGNVYPCDAMKYFDYLGSGGNIMETDIKSIYYSNYFQEIRSASKNINEVCGECHYINCKGGCLAQKMLEVMKKDESQITARWYQENALRTMNHFDNEDILKLNAYTGIVGEYGELFDYIKKLYTHNLSLEKKQEILLLAPKEIGDLVWYLSTSLALFYHYTLDEVYEYLFHQGTHYYQVNANLIQKASFNQDPLCSFCSKNSSYAIDSVYSFYEYDLEQINEQKVFSLLLDFKKILNELDYIETKEGAIAVVARIFVEAAKISKMLFHKNLSEILEDNILKLRSRYPEGFDVTVANTRIDFNKKYKEDENYGISKGKRLTRDC